MTKKKEKHSDHYYDIERNGWNHTTTLDDFSRTGNENIEVEVSVPEGYEFNQSYKLYGYDIPDYYIGNNGYEARKVVEGFELTYNIGTAVTYLLRANKKHDTPKDCIKKAITHLEFELEKLNNEENNNS